MYVLLYSSGRQVSSTVSPRRPTLRCRGRCETRVLKSRYYAVPIPRLMALMIDAGFVDVQRNDHVLFQPVLLGRRPNAI